MDRRRRGAVLPDPPDDLEARGDQTTLNRGRNLAEDVERLETFVAELPALERILDGERAADSGEQWMRAAELASQREEHELAARTFVQAFLEQPYLESEYDQRRYQAACAAALCGTGRGRDARALDAEERVRWRRQALVWLRGELDALREHTDQPDVVVTRLRDWKRDDDLACVRDDDLLAELSVAEQVEWRELWSDVELVRAVMRDAAASED
jgi:hypothetical protein